MEICLKIKIELYVSMKISIDFFLLIRNKNLCSQQQYAKNKARGLCMILDENYLLYSFFSTEELVTVKAFESKYLKEGPVTAELDRQFAGFVGAKHVIAVTSCMTGLVLVHDALGVGKGDEVIVPDYIHPAKTSDWVLKE